MNIICNLTIVHPFVYQQQQQQKTDLEQQQKNSFFDQVFSIKNEIKLNIK